MISQTVTLCIRKSFHKIAIGNGGHHIHSPADPTQMIRGRHPTVSITISRVEDNSNTIFKRYRVLRTSLYVCGKMIGCSH